MNNEKEDGIVLNSILIFLIKFYEINEMPILSDLFGVWFAGCAKVRCHKGWSACGMEDIEM